MIYITAAAFIVTALFSVTACRGESGSDNKPKGLNAWLTAVIQGSPSTLDPQTCSDDSAVQVISCVFRGLYRAEDGGNIVPDLAESVSVSDDGLIWSFKLREGVKWYGKDDFSADCTADDFVFAFRRLMNPALHSGRAAEYYCIKNAKEINTGKIKDLTQLGIEASGKYELTIKLCEPRTDLEALLAAPPAMPCNAGYYERTEGQYGLVADCIGSNGEFYVSRWHYDKWTKSGNFLELKRNELNADLYGTLPRGITFPINEDEYEYFLNGDADAFATTDTERIFRLEGKYGYETYSGAVWGIVFNTEGVFSDPDLRIALGGFVKGDFDSDIYTAADCMIPDGVKIGGADYRALAGKPDRVSYSEAELTERGVRAMSKLEAGALSGMKLLIPEGTALKQSLGGIIQRWQRNFGVYCMISELDPDSFDSALSGGDFDAALVRFPGGSGAEAYISAFGASSPKNYGKVNSRKLEDIIGSTLTASDSASAARYCLEAEQFILDNGWFAPLCFDKEYVFRADGVSGIAYDPYSGTILFGSTLKS